MTVSRPVSYYSHHTRTASGERFNPRELTAAHRTLPFGTRVRVTELTTGRSVTLRINDRGYPSGVREPLYRSPNGGGLLGLLEELSARREDLSTPQSIAPDLGE